MENESTSWTKFEKVNGIVNFLAGAQSLSLLYFSVTSEWEISFKVTVALLSGLNFALIIITYRTIVDHHQDNKQNALLQITNKIQADNIAGLEGRLSDSKNTHKNTSIIIHNICHEHRRILYYLLYDFAGAGKLKRLSIESSFKKYFMFLLANVKEIFDILTGDECSACIKLIDGSGDVRTFMRDPISYRSRHETDKHLTVFKGSGNTAFNLILSPDFSDTYFANDNLKEHENYSNANTKWRKLYNASIVAPIRISLPSTDIDTDEDSYVLGFICVDNLKGNFNNVVCINTLSAIGDLCFHLFYTYDNLEGTQEVESE
ncbi:MAG: hypothetical protein U9R69_11085 [Thermodesulfobacteriota bacterium]|nr:hypothetical protein [Thermodesulfobacteriota bacterium]